MRPDSTGKYANLTGVSLTNKPKGQCGRNKNAHICALQQIFLSATVKISSRERFAIGVFFCNQRAAKSEQIAPFHNAPTAAIQATCIRPF